MYTSHILDIYQTYLGIYWTYIMHILAQYYRVNMYFQEIRALIPYLQLQWERLCKIQVYDLFPNDQKSRCSPGPNFYFKALRISWLLLSCTSGAQAVWPTATPPIGEYLLCAHPHIRWVCVHVKWGKRVMEGGTIVCTNLYKWMDKAFLGVGLHVHLFMFWRVESILKYLFAIQDIYWQQRCM